MVKLTIAMFCAIAVHAAEWKQIFNGKDLTGWEVVGDGIWTVLRDGTLVGQRDLINNGPRKQWIEREQFRGWLDTQSWLYTKEEFGEFDLHLEYWLRHGGNSGISLRDPSRGKYGVITPPDFKRTPSKLGYEIQLANHYPDPQPSGSIYTFIKAEPGAQIDNQWNAIDIQCRDGAIRVKINGKLVAQHATDPNRPKTGPVGLQLHDQFSVVMFRNIKLLDLLANRRRN
jgi:hypothetical protein